MNVVNVRNNAFHSLDGRVPAPWPLGTALSTAMAASLVIAVIRTDPDQRALGDVVSAHVRSLQGDHLTDVQTSDQHTVKPWLTVSLISHRRSWT